MSGPIRLPAPRLARRDSQAGCPHVGLINMGLIKMDFINMTSLGGRSADGILFSAE
jgi:hypothetical protein